MQCNTNYTNSLENFKYLNLNVIKTYENIFLDVILGLSDHTPGHISVLAAVTLGMSYKNILQIIMILMDLIINFL